MKFGINILNFGPRANPETLQRWALFAEEVGFHLVMISDHVAITPDVQGQFPVPFYDPFVTLGWLAGLTKKVEIGTTVAILPYRHPLLTARMAANLDQISGGRFILGVGVGWAEQEFVALDTPFGQRGVLSDEYLEVIDLCLRQEVVSYHGKYVSFDNIHTAPKSVQSPRLPIWVGGKTDSAIRRAARYGDSWHPYQVRVDWLQEVGMPKLRQYAAAAQKPIPKLSPRITFELTNAALSDRHRVAGQGSLAQIRADLATLEAIGTDYVLLDTFIGHPDGRLRQPENDWAMLETLAEEVLDLANQTIR